MIGIIVLVSLAFVFGIIITNLDKSMKDNVADIENLLPGYNCGACGYKGCTDMAEHISKDPSLYTKCRILRGDNLEKMKKYISETYGVAIK